MGSIKQKEKIIKGLLLSPGVAMGEAFVIDKLAPIPIAEKNEECDVFAEIERLRENIREVKRELASLRDQVSAEIGEDKGQILDVQLFVIDDVYFIKEIERAIEEKGVVCEVAIYEVLKQYEDKFLRINDTHLRDKYLDVKDVLFRMLNRGYFKGRQKDLRNAKNKILVCEQILPTTLLGFDKNAFVGIVTVTGGLGSHAVILARSYGIPAIGVDKGITKKISDGQLVCIDGYSSAVYLDPSAETQQKYSNEIIDYNNYRSRIKTRSGVVTKTSDNVEIEILANCGTAEDARDAEEMGANGIGLFRTEVMFYANKAFPTEEEQYQYYKQVIESQKGDSVTFRTLDLGGDKALPYFLIPKQVNPYLGWRSLKVSFDHPNEFKTQLKAILRAGALGTVKLLFPMVTNFSDIIMCKGYLRTCQNELRAENKDFDEGISIGAMVETPSAVTCLSHILSEVDFISIGSNDLIQHILAVDRDNPKVSQFYVAHHPAVLANLKTVFDEAAKFEIPVTLCGEMASHPVYTAVLLGMGLRRFSMAPNLVPIIKDVISNLSLAHAEEIAKAVLSLRTSEEIISKLKEDILKHYPDFKRIF